MKQLLSIFSTLVLLLVIVPAYAQQGNNWVFGYHGGLTFNTSPPSVFTDSLSGYYTSIWASNSSSISNCQGNLLFYTSGIKIWNRFHTLMPHGDMGLPTGVSVGLNTALILPVPSDSNRYYLIYSYESNKKPNTVGGLYYTIIDMRLDSGRGDVSLTKSVQIAKISGFYGINVNTIKDNNSINWWLVYPQDDSVIVSLKVDSSGIKNPYYSYVRTNTFMAGHIRGSHNGKKLLAGNHPTDLNYSAILFDFDSKSGKVSNPQNLHYNNPKDKKKRYNTSSIEFSDNDSFLYTSVANNYNDYEKKIWQYEVYAADPDKTEQVIATIKPDLFTPPGLQIGPDNKIYTGTYGTQYMGVINYPEKKGLGCKYIDSAFSIAPEYCGFIMPSIYAPLHTIQWQAVGFCRDSISFKNLSDFRYFKYFKWYFGDGDSSTAANPFHHYKTPGKYYVRMAALNTCQSFTWYSDSIQVWPRLVPGFSIDSVRYTCGKAITYLRSTASGQSNLSYNFGDNSGWDSTRNPIHTFTKVGTFSVKQAVNNGTCFDTIIGIPKINIEKFPKSDFVSKDSGICVSHQALLKNLSKNDFFRIWEFDDGGTDSAVNSLHIFSDTGFHWVRLTSFNHQGCSDGIVKQVYIPYHPAPVAKFKTDKNIACITYPFQISNQSLNSDSCVWDFGDGSIISNSSASFIHTFLRTDTLDVKLKIFSPNGCSALSDQKIVVLDTFKASFIMQPNSGCIPLLIQFSNMTKEKDLPLKYMWNFPDTTFSTEESISHTFKSLPSGKYSVQLNVSNGYCSDSLTQNINIKSVSKNETIFPYLITVKNNNSIWLAWHKNFNATFYLLERSKANGSFEILKDIIDTFYNDLDVDVNAFSYSYRISASDNCGNHTLPSLPIRSILLTGQAYENEKVILNWNTYLGWRNAGYQIMRSDDDNAEYSLVFTNDTDFVDNNFFAENAQSRSYYAEAISIDSLKSRSNTITNQIEPVLWIPNVFTPNGDGLNDEFKVKGSGLKQFSIRIYNEWGEKVFESTDLNQGWNGGFHGSFSDGVYIFSIQAQTTQGEWIYKKGTIQVLK